MIGTAGAADVNDTDVADDSSQTILSSQDVGVLTESSNGTDDDSNETVIRNATFSKVSKSDYLVGDLFTVTLKDTNGTAIFNKTVYFTINGKISPVSTDENGSAKFKLDIKKGFYTLTYNFNETGYNPIQSSKTILVLTKGISTISPKNLKGYAGIKYAYKITLKVDGILMPNRQVKIVINKKTYYKKTNAQGVATFTVYLAKGTYKIKYYFNGEEIIKSSKSSSVIKLKLMKNPYGTKNRHVYIDADGGFTKKFLKEVANRLRKAGWKVTVYGIGPGQHSKNYKKVRNGVYMPFYNGLCAATIKEMAAGYYGGVIKSHHSVLAPSWCNCYKMSKLLTKYDSNISKVTFLQRAWDDNFSPASFKGMSYPAKFMTKNKIRYSSADSTYGVVEQFLYGGWDAFYKNK